MPQDAAAAGVAAEAAEVAGAAVAEAGEAADAGAAADAAAVCRGEVVATVRLEHSSVAFMAGFEHVRPANRLSFAAKSPGS